MRTLVVGAGAVGGYFGGRLMEAGRDVTFLVRPRRAAELTASGLIVRSRLGDISIPKPKFVLDENLRDPFDLIILSCKAYDLENAIHSFASGVGPNTAILPLLNGMRHLDALDERFGPSRVLGGQCLIGATLSPKYEIIHLNENHDLSFGERDGTLSGRVQAIAAVMQGTKMNSHASTEILRDMWEKWMFLACLAGATCLMRAAVGDISSAPGGKEFLLGLLDECGKIGAAEGHPAREAYLSRVSGMLTAPGSPATASMLRDVERNAPIEAAHIIGDLLDRGQRHNLPLPLLGIAWTHLRAYEARRQREAVAAGKAA